MENHFSHFITDDQKKLLNEKDAELRIHELSTIKKRRI